MCTEESPPSKCVQQSAGREKMCLPWIPRLMGVLRLERPGLCSASAVEFRADCELTKSAIQMASSH